MTRDLNLKLGVSETPVNLKSPPHAVKTQNIPVQNIYFCISDNLLLEISRIYKEICGSDDLRIFTGKGKEQIFSIKDFPKDIGYIKKEGVQFIPLETKLEQFTGKDVLKVAVINGMSNSFGDSIVGLRALNIFHEKASKFFHRIKIDLYQADPMKTLMLYSKESIINNIHFLPASLDCLLEYDAYVDLDFMIMREEFNNQPLIDFYLEALSISKLGVADEKKRVFLVIDKAVGQA